MLLHSLSFIFIKFLGCRGHFFKNVPCVSHTNPQKSRSAASASAHISFQVASAWES